MLDSVTTGSFKAGVANTNSGEESLVIRHGKSVRYTNMVRWGKPVFGLNAVVLPGDSITLYGVNHNHVRGPQHVDVTFSIGSDAVYDSYNLEYVGQIVSIGEKTVTIRDGQTVRRLSIAEFASKNHDYDPLRIIARNASFLD